MKAKITFFLALIILIISGNTLYAQTVSGTASSNGCQNSSIITASSTGLGATPEYQLLKSGVVVFPIPGDAAQFSTSNVFTSLANGTYTINGRANSLGPTYSSASIVVNDGYVNMTLNTPTKVLECSGSNTTLISNATGGKAPYVFRIALQSSPGTYLETSASQTALTYTFGTATGLSAR